ncbi:MAG: hypothetical protein ACR2PL_07900 [Dehalococcoidia bacterium]
MGTAPANSGFESPPGITGTPPTNYDFASGDFSGWTKTNGPTIASDQPHGSSAKLNGGTITSSPCTVDPSAARSGSTISGSFLSADSVIPNADGTLNYNHDASVANNPTTWDDPRRTRLRQRLADAIERDHLRSLCAASLVHGLIDLGLRAVRSGDQHAARPGRCC